MISTASAPLHPGESLKEDFLDPLGISLEEIAKRTALPQAYLRDLIAGKVDCSIDAAVRLANELETSPEFWTSLQVRYTMWSMQAPQLVAN